MKALIRLDFTWTKKPGENILYFVYINDQCTELTDAKNQLYLWDCAPYRCELEIQITIEQKKPTGLFKKTSDLVLTNCTEKFFRSVNKCQQYTPKCLNLNGYVQINTVECTVSEFPIPQYYAIGAGCSTLEFVTCKEPMDVCHINYYLLDYNRLRLEEAYEKGATHVHFLEVSQIMPYCDVIVVYYKCVKIEIPVIEPVNKLSANSQSSIHTEELVDI